MPAKNKSHRKKNVGKGKTSPIISIFTDFLSFAFDRLSVFVLVCKPRVEKRGKKSFSYSDTF